MDLQVDADACVDFFGVQYIMSVKDS